MFHAQRLMRALAVAALHEVVEWGLLLQQGCARAAILRGVPVLDALDVDAQAQSPDLVVRASQLVYGVIAYLRWSCARRPAAACRAAVMK